MKPKSETVIIDEVLAHSNIEGFIARMCRELIEAADKMENPVPIPIREFQAATARRDLQWDPENKLDLAFRAVELAGEAGELCNVVKKLEREARGLRGSRVPASALAEEAGDVLICLLLLCNTAGIDLEEAARHKFNASSIKLGLDERL